MTMKLFSIYVIVLVRIICEMEFSFALLSCRDENDNEVDWFILYKLPKNIDGNVEQNLKNGTGYAFFTSQNAGKWQLSTKSIEAQDSMLGHTYNIFSEHNDYTNDLGYLFYNDSPPEGYKGTASQGHIKGMLAFNANQGFWLSHSIPKFGRPSKYEYPKTALIYGQAAICISFKTQDYLNTICTHLVYSAINAYEYYIRSQENTQLLDERTKTLFTSKPTSINTWPYQKYNHMESLQGQEFELLAKNNQLKIDIYSEYIAPTLNINLYATTWRNGKGGLMDPYCEKGKNKVANVQSINMSAKGAKQKITFKTDEDHSKWAVSQDKSYPITCIGDLNRMDSQKKRGGGAICMEHEQVWDNFYSIVDKTDQCSNSTK